MKGGIRVGAIWGIPLYIDPSLVLILGLLTIDFSASYTRIAPNLAWLFGLITALLLFTSILLHELGHSLTARANGIGIEAITLNFLGGLTSMKRETQNPGTEFKVAIAGPLVSLALAIVLLWTAFLLQAIQPIISIVALQLGQINLVLGIFNLLPGLPLDGGQVLKAAVWKYTGNYFTGIRVAARSGQVLGWFGILWGFAVSLSSGQFLSGLWLIVLGWFILANAGAYLQLTDLQQALSEITAETAMTRDFRIIDADMSIRQFADEFLLMRESETQPLFFASSNGRDRGMVIPSEIKNSDRQEWVTKTINDITKPIKSLDVVELNTKITEVIKILETKKLRELTVLSRVGSVAGVIDRGDIIRALSQKLNWRISESYIKQIKAEGRFPLNLNLLEIISQIST
ncbi:Zn-dependent protease [Synechococcus sp. PCC 7502]|uniref:site-2 protease family protein n=1 Tax=Synechococcus sp. PCC 7502 TaxID=1173263 RepID=UPI00029FEDCA|nr:site-2 protease family protein [Synechococcus sp. PCC 7502]AFY73653.1 Zn-dependent protease [Synechococcus sp. PCC 7502]